MEVTAGWLPNPCTFGYCSGFPWFYQASTISLNGLWMRKSKITLDVCREAQWRLFVNSPIFCSDWTIFLPTRAYQDWYFTGITKKSGYGSVEEHHKWCGFFGLSCGNSWSTFSCMNRKRTCSAKIGGSSLYLKMLSSCSSLWLFRPLIVSTCVILPLVPLLSFISTRSCLLLLYE